MKFMRRLVRRKWMPGALHDEADECRALDAMGFDPEEIVLECGHPFPSGERLPDAWWSRAKSFACAECEAITKKGRVYV